MGQQDWSWEDFIQAGFAPDFHQELDAPMQEKWEPAERCDGWIGSGSRIGGDYLLLDLQIRPGDRDFGACYHLAVSGDGIVPLRQQLPLITELCQALLAVIDRSQEPDRAAAERFLFQLLEGMLGKTRLLELRANLLDFQTEGFFVLLLVDIASYRPTESSVTAISSALEGLTNGISTVCGSYLAVLERCRSDAEGHAPAYCNKLESCLRQYGLRAARSRMFYALREAPVYRRQAETLLKLPVPTGGRVLLDFDHMATLVLAASLPPDEQRDAACHPIIRHLVEMDRESKFSYIETLRAYLQSGQRAATACARLHIHRNTLDYRLRKLEDETPIDWTDGELLFQLYFSIQLLDVIGR